MLVGQKNCFKVYFDCSSQSYIIYKDDKFLIGNKYRFRDVQSYLT